MSIDADMILENERFEQETIRENLRVFLANQEAERLRCERLRENTASRSSAGRSASIDNLTSAVGLHSGLTIRLPPLSQLHRRTQSANQPQGSSPDFVGSPNIYRSHDHVSSIQMISKDDLLLFKCLPWLTDAVVRPFDKTEEYGVQGIVQLIVEKEGTLFTGERSNAFYEKMLVSHGSVSETARHHKPDNVEKSHASNWLFMYRLIDAIAFAYGGEQIESTVPRKSFLPLTIPGWRALCNDWPRFVREAGTVLYQDLAEVDRSTASTQTDATLKCLESVCQRVARMDRNKMLVNFEVAALHLSLLLKGRDYPDTVAELAGLGLEKLEEIASRTGTHGLRFPLHLALAVSPCVLLLQTMLHKQEVGRLHLVERWQRMGGARPQLLKDIELQLWQGILHIARSAEADTHATLKAAFQKIDALVGFSVDVGSIDWFDGAHLDEVQMEVDQATGVGHGLDNRTDASELDEQQGGGRMQEPGQEAEERNNAADVVPNEEAMVTGDILPDTSRGPVVDQATGVGHGLNNRGELGEQRAGGRMQEPGQEAEERNDAADVPPNEEAMVTGDILPNASGGPVHPPIVDRPLKRGRSPGSSRRNPIDLTSERQVCIDGKICELVDLSQDKEEMPERSLTKTTTTQARVTGPPRLLYDVFGKAFSYTPSFHHLADLDAVTQLMDRVEQDFHSSGRPLHIADPARSNFRILTVQEFERMEDEELQAMHASHHLLVTGYPQASHGFDAKGLATLAPTSRVFTIHDYSVAVTSDENQRHRHGTTAELLGSYLSNSGKILNALDFPLNNGSNPPMALSSDLLAFRAMASKGATEEYPTTDMRWGLAATQGAFTGFHIDADGLATTVYCVNRGGSKWWIIVGPKDKANISPFASVEKAYAFHNHGLDVAALGDVQVEAVLLTPGVRLYMRPNTPHAVLTPEAAICHGGHYLAASNLRSTCHGFLMGFSLSTLLTNTTHTSACQLLFRKILAYYYAVYTKGRPDDAGPLESPVPHVPDPSTFDGIHDLFSLCNIVEMANILHPDSYHGGLSVSQRQEMIKGRFLSRAIVSWVISNYDIELVTTETFYWKYLAYQARAVCYAKKFGDSRGAYSYTGVPLAKEVHRLIEDSFRDVDGFWEQWESFSGAKLDTFAWPADDLHTVKIRKPRVQAKLAWNADGRNHNDVHWASERAARPIKRLRLTIKA